MLDRQELACSGKFFKVVPVPDVFTDVLVHDFTHLFSSTGAALMKEEDRPQLSLYFTDRYGNVQDETAFTENLKFSIVDIFTDTLVFLDNDPSVKPIGSDTRAYTLDFCKSATGIV